MAPAVFQILIALADQPLHGYGIMLDIAERSAGKVKLSPGTLYGSIKRMLADGLIEETDERPDPELDDQRRRYYRLTALGRRVGAAEHQRLDRLLSAAQARRLGLTPGFGAAS